MADRKRASIHTGLEENNSGFTDVTEESAAACLYFSSLQ